jgi:hypothetical protein
MCALTRPSIVSPKPPLPPFQHRLRAHDPRADPCSPTARWKVWYYKNSGGAPTFQGCGFCKVCISAGFPTCDPASQFTSNLSTRNKQISSNLLSIFIQTQDGQDAVIHLESSTTAGFLLTIGLLLRIITKSPSLLPSSRHSTIARSFAKDPSPNAFRQMCLHIEIVPPTSLCLSLEPTGTADYRLGPIPLRQSTFPRVTVHPLQVLFLPEIQTHLVLLLVRLGLVRGSRTLRGRIGPGLRPSELVARVKTTTAWG